MVRSFSGWRGRTGPQELFAKVGRRVRCRTCGTWQRTDPAKHRAGFRLREMDCVKLGCTGRLMSQYWWRKIAAGIRESERLAEAQSREDSRLTQDTGFERLGVYVGSLGIGNDGKPRAGQPARER